MQGVKPGTLRRAICLALELSVVAVGVEGVRGSRNAGGNRQGEEQRYDDLHGCFFRSIGVMPLVRHRSRLDTWVRRRLIPSFGNRAFAPECRGLRLFANPFATLVGVTVGVATADQRAG